MVFVYAGYLCMFALILSNPSVWLLFVCFNVWNEIIVNINVSETLRSL